MRDCKPRYSKHGLKREIILYEASTDSPRRKAEVATAMKSQDMKIFHVCLLVY